MLEYFKFEFFFYLSRILSYEKTMKKLMETFY
jgi:hypothetical protein